MEGAKLQKFVPFLSGVIAFLHGDADWQPLDFSGPDVAAGVIAITTGPCGSSKR